MAFYIRLALFCEISQGTEVFSWQKKWCKFLFIWIQTKTSTDTSRDKQNNVSRICVVKTAKQRLEFAPRSCYLIQRYSFDIVAVWILTQTTITCLRRLWAGRTNVKVFTHEIGSMYNSSKHVFRRRQWWKGSSYWKNCNLFLNGFGKVLKKEGFLSIETTGTWNLSL